ncbi:MAG: nucleotidyltransferase family protein [Oscillospiraceae bacterium]|nr:nucleotidyltransferase family protein [Oscillospiraceae bacterium]
MRNVIGVAAEYNPFHEGHLRHLERTREALGGGAAVCVLSGSFVQRGEPALFGKHARAEAAVRCGADLVLELPLAWSLSSAEGYARGCVGVLAGLGVVTHMSFGSECGEIAPLDAVAAALLDRELDAAIRTELDSGVAYPVARQRVLERSLGRELASLVESPNNILAIEYLKALYRQGAGITPVTVKRIGAGHDEAARAGELPSASELRTRVIAGENVFSLLPEGAAEVFSREKEQGRGPVTLRELETALLSRLRCCPEEIFGELPDATEGLGQRLYRAAHTEPTIEAVYAAAATKRYPMARLRRMTMAAALGLRAGMADGTPPYARVLAFNETGRELLHRIGESDHIPVLTRPVSIREQDDAAQKVFALGAAAEDLYALGYRAREERTGGADWRQSPVFVRKEVL